ncbi:hypothetical protein GCM10010365_42040 [Streptomyces poonensis]|uniref:Uncharacterized protein n=1 Tax=Streptomyces poonensis TaxID=68255 RepID=A0A918PQL3_9ACTN|nr:hypothetical protein GCM10010365_42040 [Streptomyces poonensis]GLJ90986.1 hypothetical protein GCM10017589_35920 [Streptomyces poonensis]
MATADTSSIRTTPARPTGKATLIGWIPISRKRSGAFLHTPVGECPETGNTALAEHPGPDVSDLRTTTERMPFSFARVSVNTVRAAGLDTSGPLHGKGGPTHIRPEPVVEVMRVLRTPWRAARDPCSAPRRRALYRPRTPCVSLPETFWGCCRAAPVQ